MDTRALSRDEWDRRVHAGLARLDDPSALAGEEAVEMIRLANTASFYPSLRVGDAVALADRLEGDCRDRITSVLTLEPTRGFALRSAEFGVTWGGVLPEDSRYEIEGAETAAAEGDT